MGTRTFGGKDPSEESTRGRRQHVAEPTRGRHTWQGEGPLVGSQRVASASFQETTRMGTYNVAEPNFGRKASNAWQAYVARRGSPDGMSVRGRRRFRRNHPYGNLDVAAPNFGTKDPSELAGAGFEESTLMGTFNVAGPNFGRRDRSEQASNAWHAYVARPGSPAGKSTRGRRKLRRNHPYGNL